MKKFFTKKLEAVLKKLAIFTLARYKPGVIGITGNVGKTSAKEAVKKVFESDRRVRAPSKNFNNEIGLPLTILGDWAETGGASFWLKVIFSSLFRLIIKSKTYPELLILEYGVDAPNDMKKLLEIVKPNIGVMTQIGDIPVHLEFFSSRESLIREKGRLISALPATGFAVLNIDDKDIYEMRNNTRARVITYGFSEAADIKISNLNFFINNHLATTTFKLNFGGSFVPVKLEKSLGKAQVYAVSAAAATAVAFGMNIVKIAENLSPHAPPPGRLNVLKGIKNSTIIDDTYNASPLSMKEALETLKKLKSRRRIAVLGDMLELGSKTILAHESIGAITVNSAKILITVGKKAKIIAETALKNGLSKKNCLSFDKTNDALEFLKGFIEPDDLILVKASQSVRLEKIVNGIMAEPAKADHLLVRQNDRWQKKPGLYD